MTAKSNNASSVPVVEAQEKGERTAPTRPKLIFPLGRGSRGKSFLARWVIDRAQSQGREIVVADADRSNPALAAYFSGVLTPPNADARVMQQWFKALCTKQISDNFNMLVDLGGGNLLLQEMARKWDLVSFLEKHGVDVVVIHLIGAYPDDLANLRDLEADRLVAPEATILVLNESAAPSNLSVEEAFQPLLEHTVFREALNRGAKLVWMPLLEPAQEVEARRLIFTAAEAGAVTTGARPVDIWARQAIHMWLRDMERNFAPVAHWLA